MTTEQLSRPLVGDRLVDRWTRLYTRRLDDETARARRDEIASDRYDHIAAARAAGLTSAATSRALAARMLLGVPADLSWRRHHLRDERRAVGKENAMARQAPDQRGWLAAAAGILVVSWILLIAVLSGLSSVANDWPTIWTSVFFFVVVLTVAVVGLVRLVRGHSDGAFVLAAAAIGSTVWLFWFPIIPVIGVAVAIGLVVYGVRARRQSPAAPGGRGLTSVSPEHRRRDPDPRQERGPVVGSRPRRVR